jgi:raffinose/stachyose/melibiose transport system substrate-binding protein
MKFSKPRPRTLAVTALIVAGSLTLAACGSSGSDSSSSSADSAGATELSFLVDNAPENQTRAKAVADAFHAANPDITITVESRPGGGDGDNLVKTKLATGDMSDLFFYNTGSLLSALTPEQNLVPQTDQPFAAKLTKDFSDAATVNGQLYGAPLGTASGGGVLYNKKVYADLGLKVPTTWDEFISNAKAIKAAGKIPVIQTYGDTWTSQLPVLADFHNVAAAEPNFAADYTANKTNYTKSPAAIKGFERLQTLHDDDLVNPDYASATYADGLKMVADGDGAMYPMLAGPITEIATTYPDKIADIGFFAQPGDDAATNGLTAWASSGVYIPKTVTGDKLTAAEKFLAFISSKPGCDAQLTVSKPTGPFEVTECTLPADVPAAVNDVQAYFKDGKWSPALEFLSPIKGPSLEQITVTVGSGITSAQDGAAQYDADVVKQAQQLGLPGW